MGIRKLFSNPMFLIAIVMMVCSGASELAMAQWASAYAESALGFSKAVGDIAGPCMFAVMMGISRVLFGKAGDKMKLNRFMIGSGILYLSLKRLLNNCNSWSGSYSSGKEVECSLIHWPCLNWSPGDKRVPVYRKQDWK